MWEYFFVTFATCTFGPAAAVNAPKSNSKGSNPLDPLVSESDTSNFGNVKGFGSEDSLEEGESKLWKDFLNGEELGVDSESRNIPEKVNGV